MTLNPKALHPNPGTLIPTGLRLFSRVGLGQVAAIPEPPYDPHPQAQLQTHLLKLSLLQPETIPFFRGLGFRV